MKSDHHEQVQDLLKNLAMFADVPDSVIAMLAAHCVITHYAKDALVFEQGDPCHGVRFVLSGRVKIIFQDVDGREVILEMIQPGEVFGGGVLFFDRQPATARTAEAAILCNLPLNIYQELITQHAGVAIRLLRMLGQRQYSMLRTQALIGERVERRIAHILLMLADRCGYPDPEGTLIAMPLSRQDLADMAGTTLESAIRVLSRFARERWIHTDRGGYIIIQQRQHLAAIAQSD